MTTLVTCVESCLKHIRRAAYDSPRTGVPTPIPFDVRKAGLELTAVSITLSLLETVNRIRPPPTDTPKTGPWIAIDEGTLTMAIWQRRRSFDSRVPTTTGPMPLAVIKTPAPARHDRSLITA